MLAGGRAHATLPVSDLQTTRKSESISALLPVAVAACRAA
jgi:hypothetical protein